MPARPVVGMGLMDRNLNLVLSGGGIKGIAYVGMFEVIGKRGYRLGNMSGVSAGALLGAFEAAGYSSSEMWKVMSTFDFKGIQVVNKPENLPVVEKYLEYAKHMRLDGYEGVISFLNSKNTRSVVELNEDSDISDYRCELLNNIITYSKQGCLFNGDYLEEWVSEKLAMKGVRTFGDLRGGKADRTNPKGYRLRMTGVDVNRAKLVVLPDDAEFYGIAPDRLEVAKAVRISTCVPFAFKPVVLTRTEGNKLKSYNLVDGGVFDRFPYWLIDNDNRPTVGFTLSGGEKSSFFSIDTPLNILKTLISAVQDIGIPKDVKNEIKHIGDIDTTKVHYLDFNLSDEDKEYLYSAGRQTAKLLFDKFEGREYRYRRGFFPRFYRRPR